MIGGWEKSSANHYTGELRKGGKREWAKCGEVERKLGKEKWVNVQYNVLFFRRDMIERLSIYLFFILFFLSSLFFLDGRSLSINEGTWGVQGSLGITFRRFSPGSSARACLCSVTIWLTFLTLKQLKWLIPRVAQQSRKSGKHWRR